MSTGTLPTKNSTRASDAHRTVDADFAAVLEIRFGIPTAYILRALEGEPRQPAVALCRLATRYEEPGGTLLRLARKHRRRRARLRRTGGTPTRGRGEVSPEPCVDRPGRGRDTPERMDVAADGLHCFGLGPLPTRPGAT